MKWFAPAETIQITLATAKVSSRFLIGIKVATKDGQKLTCGGKSKSEAYQAGIKALVAANVSIDTAIIAVKAEIKSLRKRGSLRELRERVINDYEECLYQLRSNKKSNTRELGRCERELERSKKLDLDKTRGQPDAQKNHSVYSIDWDDDIYVGITQNTSQRFAQHLSYSHNSGVRKIVSAGAIPIVIASNLSHEEALAVESDLIRTMRSTSKTVHNIVG